MKDPGGHAVALSSAQERLWLLEQLQPGSTVYSLSLARRVSGALDAANSSALLRRTYVGTRRQLRGTPHG